MSALPFPDLGNLDDLDELLEESTRTVTAKTVDDLDDLDQLLAESTDLANAKRAKATGRKLSAEQAALLESNRLAAEAELWLTQFYVAHTTIEFCACGAIHEGFAAWYAYQIQRNKSGRRLLRVPRAEQGMPASRYHTQHDVSACHMCVASLPQLTVDDLDLLGSLK